MKTVMEEIRNASKGPLFDARRMMFRLKVKLAPLPNNCKKHLKTIQECRTKYQAAAQEKKLMMMEDVQRMVADLLREHALKNSLSAEALYEQLRKVDAEAPVNGDAEHLEATTQSDRLAALRSFLQSKKEMSAAELDMALQGFEAGISRFAFLDLVEEYRKCVKEVAVTATSEVKSSTTRKLEIDEVVQVLGLPSTARAPSISRAEEASGLLRARCRILRDNIEGYVTLNGTQDASSAQQLGTASRGERLEVLEGPRLEETTQVTRARGKATKDGLVGWVLFKDETGRCFFELQDLLLCKGSVALTDSFDIGACKAIRKLEVGETLQSLEERRKAPQQDESRSLTRIKVKALSDGKEGWATSQGNQGTLYVMETNRHFTCAESVDLEASPGKALRRLEVGESFELLQDPTVEMRPGKRFARGRCSSNAQPGEGWFALGDHVQPWTHRQDRPIRILIEPVESQVRLIGDDIYVSTWSALETSCGRPPAAQRLTPRFALERVQERIRRKEWINETERRTFLRLAQLAEERHCKAESLSYLLWSTLLSLDAANLVCRGDGFMNETALYLKLAPLTFDDCSPFFALPLSRMDFVLVLMTRWPIFEELQLLSERLASRENNFGNEGCDLYRRDLPPPDFLLNVWPPRLRDTTLMCGGLRLALVYLEKVLQLQGHAPGRNLTNFWKKSVRVAERSLKSLAYRFGIAELLGAIGELPQSKSPWVAKQVGDECTSDAECETGICALTWYGFASREYAGDFFDGYALKACQLKLQDTAEMVFNTKKLNKYRGKIAFIRALFLREIGVALGIGSTWKYLGIAYKDPKKRNTLKNLYANTDDVAGGLYWSSNFGMTHGVVELDKTTRQMPLPKPIPRCCGYAQDVMKASLESATVIGPQSVGFLNALGYTIDYQNANQPLFVSVPCDGCDAEPQLFKPNMLVKERSKRSKAVIGLGCVEGSGLDSVSARPAGRPCTRDEDCSGVCVTSMVGFLEAKGYNLYDEGIRGFASKVCKPKHHDFDIDARQPDYDYIYEEARQKWLSIIRGIARPIRYDVNPVNLVIETAWFVASSDIIAYSGPTEAHFVDSADGSYWIPKKGILQFNLDFLLNDRMSLKQFKAYVLQQMGKVLLIGLWDLLTTSAQCMEPDRFTDAYLDGGGNVRTGLV
eukprot:g22935.t1